MKEHYDLYNYHMAKKIASLRLVKRSLSKRKFGLVPPLQKSSFCLKDGYNPQNQLLKLR